jgi:hypothetical protein
MFYKGRKLDIALMALVLCFVCFKVSTENFRMGTRGNAKKENTQREMDRWSKTKHDKPWTDRRGY